MPSRNCIQYKVQATEKEGEKHCTPAEFLWPEVSFYVVYMYLKNMKKKFSQKCRRGHHFLLAEGVGERHPLPHLPPRACCALGSRAMRLQCPFHQQSPLHFFPWLMHCTMTLTLTLIEQCPMSNLSELFSYMTMSKFQVD